MGKLERKILRSTFNSIHNKAYKKSINQLGEEYLKRKVMARGFRLLK